MQRAPLTYLALGDSYTIGEAVLFSESFPHQTVQMLSEKGVPLSSPEIIATTGWTTGELDAAIKQSDFLKNYDLVTLLIGVNNQYRGLSLEDYKIEFSDLLKKAIDFAGGRPKNVFVLSIPDYGATPFAKDHNPQKIAAEIAAFNTIAKAICVKSKVVFIDITWGSKAALHDAELVAADGLHPSGKEYHKWAEQLTKAASGVLK